MYSEVSFILGMLETNHVQTHGGDRLGLGHLEKLYKAPTDYTKPQQTIQRHRILIKYCQKNENAKACFFFSKRHVKNKQNTQADCD